MLTVHWRKAGLVKTNIFRCIRFLRVQFNFLWSIRTFLYSLWEKFLSGNYLLDVVGRASFVHNSINIEGWRLLEKAANWSLLFVGHLSNSLAVSVESSDFMVVEFIFSFLYNGAFPVTAWEEHVLGLDDLKLVSYLVDLGWFHPFQWGGDWFNWWIWRNNGNWKVGAVSLSHDGVRVVSWAEWFFIIEGIFLINFFYDILWTSIPVEEILTGEPSSLWLDSKSKVNCVSLVLLSGAENILDFGVVETLFILITWVKVENRTFFIAWWLVAHFINKVNWWEAFWFQECVDSGVSKFIMCFLVEDDVFKVVSVIFEELSWGV